MHKRILVCVNKNEFEPFDYSLRTQDALKSMGMNSGNNIFEFSLQKMLLSKNIEVDTDDTFFHKNYLFLEKIDDINNKYDAIVLNTANIIAKWAKNTKLPEWTNAIKQIKIPVYVLSLGAQSDYDYSFKFLKYVRKEAQSFIKAILDTGGKIAIRGYFTAEVLKKLGFRDGDFSVTGCPSVYLNAGKTEVIKKNISRNELKPLLNGDDFWFKKEFHHFFDDFPKSVFIDQHYFYSLLYSPQDINGKDFKTFQNGLFLKLFKEDRVKMFCDYLPWNHYITQNGFNFSVGGRIHGNIVSILAGIQSCIEIHDSRVREMAEFYYIPSHRITGKTDLFELYEACDYTLFNKNISKKFQNFKNWMHSCGLPCFEDEVYINNFINNLDLNYPNVITKYEDLEGISYSTLKATKSFWYRLLHFYWLRNKK